MFYIDLVKKAQGKEEGGRLGGLEDEWHDEDLNQNAE